MTDEHFLADDGFTKRVMAALPAAAPATTKLPIAAWGVAAAVIAIILASTGYEQLNLMGWIVPGLGVILCFAAVVFVYLEADEVA